MSPGRAAISLGLILRALPFAPDDVALQAHLTSMCSDGGVKAQPICHAGVMPHPGFHCNNWLGFLFWRHFRGTALLNRLALIRVSVILLEGYHGASLLPVIVGSARACFVMAMILSTIGEHPLM